MARKKTRASGARTGGSTARKTVKSARRVSVVRAGTVSARRPLWVESLPTHGHWEALEQAMRRSLDLAHAHDAPARTRTDLAARLKRLQELRAWCHQITVSEFEGITGPDRAATGRAAGGLAHRARQAKGGVNRGLESLK